MNKLSTLIVKRIWKDTVWSSVIATGIVSLIVFIASTIDFTFKTALIKFLTLKIELWVVLPLLLVVAVVITLVKGRANYDNASMTVDRNLFNKIRNELDMTTLMAKVKANNFSNAPVEINQLTKLLRLLEESNKADFEFLNPTLNKLKNNFIDELQSFELSAGRYLFGVKANAGWTSIPSEWEYEQPERMEEAFLTLQRNENDLADAYQEFISKGRSILKV